jgi:CHAT domain-containing protein
VVGFLLIYSLQRYGPLKRIREFLDFEILMEATGETNRYRLRVINAPGQAGDAKAKVILNKDKLKKELKRLQRGFVDHGFLKNFGQLLYQNLFVDNLAASYQRALTQARLEKKGLRLRLLIDAPELQTLPWEYLYDQRHDFFFSANPEILLTRDVVSEQPRRDMNVKELNVLIALSDPTPESLFMLALHELEVTDEKDLIVTALKNLRDNTDIPIRYTILEHATTDQIRQHLHEDFNVFHFIGHSTFRDGMGKIVLENDDRVAIFVDEAEFGNLFLGCSEMRLVILNSCQSATTAALPTISGLAYQVIQRGVPAVMAMQYPIADETATLFAKEFYRTLAAGHPVDFAMAHARLAIAQKMKVARPHDFGIPVLFMRAREGRIV